MRMNDLIKLVDDLKEEMGAGLMAASIVSFAQGQSIAGFNTDGKQDALLSKFTTFLVDTVQEAGFGKVGDFFAVNLPNNKVLFMLPFKEYCWSTLVDTNEIPMGMVTNFILPECIKNFRAVVSS